MNNNEERQTTIMTDEDALALQQTLSHASKAKKPGVRKANKKGEAMMYYEEDNLRIPLLDNNGRRRNPRSAKTLYTKKPIPELLATVREYAGEAKVKELENAPKSVIADWINEVETRAFGGTPSSSSKPRSDKKRKNPDSATSLQQQLKKLKLKQAEFDSVSPEGGRTINQGFNIKRSVREAGNHAELSEQASTDDDEWESLVQEVNEELSAPDPHYESPAREAEEFGKLSEEDHQLNGYNNVPDEEEEEKRLRRQEAFQANIIRIARGEHQHITTVTQQPPKFLKPGKHGYDYENDRWYFEGDPDLYTGIGHDVEPADEERLAREGDLFRGEFSEKYPGYLGHQWRCGCPYPVDYSDSDWESD